MSYRLRITALLLCVPIISGTAASVQAQSLDPTVQSFSDTSPADWAFDALQSLLERYGCVAGYPDGTFRGDRPAGRYELLAALNTCLDSLEGQSVSKEDLETVRAIQEEMMATLSSTRQKVDQLEGRTDTLDAQQFSTTTKLQGQAIIAGQFGDFADSFVFSNNFTQGAENSDVLPTPQPGRGRGIPDIDNQILGEPRGSAISRVRLSFNTSFSGQDNLNTVLEVGNGGNDYLSSIGLAGPANPFPVPPGATDQGRRPLVDLGAVDYAGVDDRVSLYRLAYTFSPVDDLTLTFGSNIYPSDFIDFNSYANNEAQDFSAGFFLNNPLIIANNIDTPGGAGGGADWRISDNFSLRGLYIGASPTDPTGGDGGLFNAPYQISGELEYKDDFGGNDDNNFAIRAQYTRSTTQNAFTVQNVFGLNAEATLGQFGVFGRYGISLNPKFGNGVGGGNLFQTEGQGRRSDIQTWMAGIGVHDIFTESSLLGFAVGQPFLVNSDQENYSPQTNLELFYRFSVSDSISLTPTFQYILNPFNIEPDAGAPDNAILQFLVRTTFSF